MTGGAPDGPPAGLADEAGRGGTAGLVLKRQLQMRRLIGVVGVGGIQAAGCRCYHQGLACRMTSSVPAECDAPVSVS